MRPDSRRTATVQRLLQELAPDDTIGFPLRKGWAAEVVARGDGESWDIILRNLRDGQQLFYLVTTEHSPYGAPMIVQEPSYPVHYRKGDVDVRIVGAIVRDAEGQVKDRFSWSNMVFMQGKMVELTPDGELKVDGESCGFLQAAFLPDMNRMQGYVGVFGPTKPEQVRVLEMEDLLFASLDA